MRPRPQSSRLTALEMNRFRREKILFIIFFTFLNGENTTMTGSFSNSGGQGAGNLAVKAIKDFRVFGQRNALSVLVFQFPPQSLFFRVNS